MSSEIARIKCPNCVSTKGDASRDNLTIYFDGVYCHSCGYTESKNKDSIKEKPLKPLIPGIFEELTNRGITKLTCEKYNVRTSDIGGKCIIFPIYENCKVVKQKLKYVDNKKIQDQRGESKNKNLFGMNVFSPTKKLPVIVTEGEEDALAVYQITNLPSVSITNGAKGAYKQLLEHIEWLSGWREIIFCFDNDEHGQSASEECVPLFEPGTVKSTVFALKDANDMLLAGKGEELKKAISASKIVKPSTVVFLSDIIDEVLVKPEYGSPTPWEFMTKVTYGFRLGEVYMIAGDSSCGKSQFVYEIVSHWLHNSCKVGLFDLERQNAQTVQRLISGIINKRIYLPDCPDFDEQEIKKELDNIKDMLTLYRPESGKISIENILINIRYLNKAYKYNYFVIDNLTALSSNVSNMKDFEFASMATGQLVQIAKELNIFIIIINHIVKDPIQLQANITMNEGYEYKTNQEGLSWDTGRMPDMGHLYGGGKVVKLPDYVIALARNRMSEESVVHRTLWVKFLKTRFESTYEGKEFKLVYDYETGKLKENNYLQ